MILLWGLPEESPMAAVSEALAGLDAKTVLADQHRLLEIEVDLIIADGEPQGRLRTPAGETDLTAINAVYLRGYDWRVLPELSRFVPGGAEWQHAAEVEDRLGAFVELTGALVVNRPSAMASNSSKPFQSIPIADHGFAVPETLITTDRAALLEFWERHGTVIYKSISGVRSIVTRLSDTHRKRLRNLASCPTQFQEYVRGEDIRVHVVGGEVYACRIVSEADDYRYAARHGHGVEITLFELPPEWTERCLALVRSMDLAVAGIDLRLTPEGRWYCFEVNPSPAFTYYEGATGHPIALAIARLLAGRK